MNITVGRKYKGEIKTCLTIREHEAFTLILCGNDNNEIARKMDISPKSIRALLAGIYKHLGYKNKNDLLVAHLDKAFVQEQINIMMGQGEDVYENFG
jgi:DNA-binding CsgD family transcriptional regulator